MTTEVQCWCRHCKKELPPSHTGPCPHCGKTGKDCKVTASVAIGLAVSASAKKAGKYARKHPGLTVASIALTIVSPIVGYLLDDALVGLLIGIILAISTLWLTPHVKETISEIKSRDDKGTGKQGAKAENNTQQQKGYSHKDIYDKLGSIETNIDSSSQIQIFAFFVALGLAFLVLGFSYWPGFLEYIGMDRALFYLINPAAFILLGLVIIIFAGSFSRAVQRRRKEIRMGTKGTKNVKKLGSKR